MSPIKEPVTSAKAAPVTAPLSQAIKSNGLIFLSGTCPVDPQGNHVGIAEKDVTKQTHQVLQNITGLLEDCGSSMAKVLKVNVFIKDMNDFKAINDVYAVSSGLPFVLGIHDVFIDLSLSLGVDLLPWS